MISTCRNCGKTGEFPEVIKGGKVGELILDVTGAWYGAFVCTFCGSSNTVQANPPTLGVNVSETLDTSDKVK